MNNNVGIKFSYWKGAFYYQKNCKIIYLKQKSKKRSQKCDNASIIIQKHESSCRVLIKVNFEKDYVIQT